MDEQIRKLTKLVIWLSIIVFVICLAFRRPITYKGYFSCIESTVSVVTVFFIMYERVLWRYIPWNRPPVLRKSYSGFIKYLDKDIPKEKHIDIKIKQTFFSVCIETKTDINSSYTIMSSIVKEHDNYVLYYTYITDPDAVVQQSNPIQFGTCRMVLNKKNDILRGKYWTTRRSIGDIEWRAENVF